MSEGHERGSGDSKHRDVDTTAQEYTARLDKATWWKRLLDVQAPYRLHLHYLDLGYVLDIGCGVGRNLANMRGIGGVGVDHNAHSVQIARSRGLTAFTPADFRSSPYAREGSFDSLLLSHVVEHMAYAEAVSLLSDYMLYLRRGGRVLIITPQEAGFRSDPTHVEFVDLQLAAKLLRTAGLRMTKHYSFPFPRPVGRVFKYNEFITIGEKLGGNQSGRGRSA